MYMYAFCVNFSGKELNAWSTSELWTSAWLASDLHTSAWLASDPCRDWLMIAVGGGGCSFMLSRSSCQEGIRSGITANLVNIPIISSAVYVLMWKVLNQTLTISALILKLECFKTSPRRSACQSGPILEQMHVYSKALRQIFCNSP